MNPLRQMNRAVGAVRAAASLVPVCGLILFLLLTSPALCVAQVGPDFHPLKELAFWSAEELPLPVYFWDNGQIVNDVNTGLSLDVATATEAAAATWTDVPTSPLDYVFMGTTTVYQENAINVYFDRLRPDAGAITEIEYNVDFLNPDLPRSNWKATNADVMMNSFHSWTTLANQSGLDFQAILTHELGHVLGLAHTFEPGQTPVTDPAVMHPSAGNLRELQPLDIEALNSEPLYVDHFCPEPLTSAGQLTWSLSADSGSGSGSTPDALAGGVLSGDLPQTTIPGLFDPIPTGHVDTDFVEEGGMESLTIGLDLGFLADGSTEISFGVEIQDLFWTDGAERDLIGLNESGELELEVDVTRLTAVSLTGGEPTTMTVTETVLASVHFDGANLLIDPITWQFDDPLSFSLVGFEVNALQDIQIRGIAFSVSVPEPSAFGLLLLMGGCLVVRRAG